MLTALALLFAAQAAPLGPDPDPGETLETQMADIKQMVEIWQSCVGNTARLWAKRPEQPETIMTGAFGKCDPFEGLMRRKMMRLGYPKPILTDQAIDNTISNYRSTWRTRGIGIIMDERTKK